MDRVKDWWPVILTICAVVAGSAALRIQLDDVRNALTIHQNESKQREDEISSYQSNHYRLINKLEKETELINQEVEYLKSRDKEFIKAINDMTLALNKIDKTLVVITGDAN